MTSSQVQSLNTSAPNISIHSESSIRAVKRGSKLTQIALFVLVILALAALATTAYLFVKETETKQAEAATKEALANEVKRINANVLTSPSPIQNENNDTSDDNAIFFSLYSTPSGADVYRNGFLFGTTPIEQKKLQKLDQTDTFIVALDGYEIVRKSIALNETFSDVVELSQITAPQAPAAQAAADRVVPNKAVTRSDPKRPKNSNSGKKKSSAAAPIDTGIVLPD